LHWERGKTKRLRRKGSILNVKVNRGFPRQVVFTLAIVALVAAYPLLRFGTREVILAAVVGAMLSTVNVLAGYVAIEYSIGKSYSTFLRTVLGGMGLRMVAMLGTLVALIKLLGFHAVALTVSLLGFYVIFLALEVIFIQKKVDTRNEG
jgi:hypothetical protein